MILAIPLSKSRETEIQFCFNYKVEFHYAQKIEDLKQLIQTFKCRTEHLVKNDDATNSIYGENKVMGLLIVMDDVSGLAGSCKEFADFLTITRKYRYHCIYVFHIIIPNKEIWKKIFQRQISIIFFHPVFPFTPFLKYFKVIVC